jgi:predicted nucleic acid-binding protein
LQILVDSSVWIDYFTGAATPQTDHLDPLLGQAPIVVADLVLAEVLHGLPDERNRRLAQGALLQFWMIEVGGLDVAVKSAVHYHTLHARGIEVRSTECLLATFCIENGFELLASSPHFEPFERYLGLVMAKPSP